MIINNDLEYLRNVLKKRQRELRKEYDREANSQHMEGVSRIFMAMSENNKTLAVLERMMVGDYDD